MASKEAFWVQTLLVWGYFGYYGVLPYFFPGLGVHPLWEAEAASASARICTFAAALFGKEPVSNFTVDTLYASLR